MSRWKRTVAFARQAPFTMLLATVSVAISTVMATRLDTAGLEFTAEQVESFGACSPTRVWTGEPWRMLTAAVVHGSPLHLLMNVLALASLGRQLEVPLGTARVVWIALLAQLGTTSASLLFGDLAPRLGASGIAFGFIGALLVGVWRRRRTTHGALGLQAVGSWVFQGLLFSLLPGIDLLGHLGGLLGGMAAMSGIEPPLSPDDVPDRRISLVASALFATVAVRSALVQPQRADWNGARAFAAYEAGRCDEALPLLELTVRKGHGSYIPEAVAAARGDCLLRLDRREEALGLLRDAALGGNTFAARRWANEARDSATQVEALAVALSNEPSSEELRLAFLESAVLHTLDEGHAVPLERLTHLAPMPREAHNAAVELVRGFSLLAAGKPEPWKALETLAPETASEVRKRLEDGELAPTVLAETARKLEPKLGQRLTTPG